MLAMVQQSNQRIEKGVGDLKAHIDQIEMESKSTQDRRHMKIVLQRALSDRMYEGHRSIGQNRVHPTAE